MDGVYPKSTCHKFPLSCSDGKTTSYTGGTWVSSGFIRGRGQPTFVTAEYDAGYPDYLTNNPPPIQIFVRVQPSQYDPSKKVFWINGWERPRLVLTRGKKYQINIVTCGHPFFFTKDSTGGHGIVESVTNIPPTGYFVTTFNVTPDLPKEFYYQCTLHPGMGGKVLIRDP